MSEPVFNPERFAGKVAFISGAARGQGRQFAVDLAKEGADIIGFDICQDIPGASVPMATRAELEETQALVEACDRRMVIGEADARDYAAVEAVLAEGIAQFGRLDVVVANAGICAGAAPFWEISLEDWKSTVDVDLTGVWHTVRAATPHILDGGRGGAIVMVASAGATKGFQNITHYVAAKTALVGMLKPMAAELGPHSVRINALSPTNVNTAIYMSETNKKLFLPNNPAPTDEEYEMASRPQHVLPVGWMETRDTSSALRWLVSDDARYVTGLELRVDAGVVLK
ncbi:mycofactocin-coupled SDR family oxidoreductase [Klenkia sp. LSe6-5]|uniref:Mycofactocin-coupled SDR family oxidoreductase n=1 Tax=Klenkia sesuvii TaxID=3103137 RepID=A0ABU8DXZ7_9ACTN